VWPTVRLTGACASNAKKQSENRHHALLASTGNGCALQIHKTRRGDGADRRPGA
jgi:hypothetical protein